MDLVLFRRMLLRRGWIVILCCLVGLAAALAFAATRTPVYGAVTRLKVQPARPTDLGQTQAIREIMASYMRDIRTYDLASAVRERLCGSAEDSDRRLCQQLDPGALRGMIEASADENVFEIRIKARSTDPVAAVKVSEQTAYAFVDRREKADRKLDLSDRVLVEIRESPQPTRDSPRRKLFAAAGAAFGALAGLAIMLLLEFLERAVILDGGDAARSLALPVLGRIPGLGRASRRLSVGRFGTASRLRADLGRAAVVVLALAALGGVAALTMSRVQQTLYVARTRIAVEPARGSDWGQSQAIREITRGFSEDIHTTGMAQEVNDRLQLDLPAADLLAKVHVAPEVDVYEITVEAFDPDPAVADEISQDWASLFVEKRGIANLELDQSDRILTRLRDRTETELWSPKTTINVLAGLFIGAMVGLGALYGLHLSRAAVIAGPEAAAACVRAPMLGAVPPLAGGDANRRIEP